MIKNYTYTLALSALLSGSFLFYSCDSSSTTVNDFSAIDDNDELTTGDSAQGLVDPDFQSTVDRFIVEANKRNVSVNLDGLDIQYGNTNRALGVCSFRGNTRRITMSNDLRNASDDLLNEIILHELGHCVLNRAHSIDPTSIMHATNIIGQPWRIEVLDELFFGS